MKLSIVKGATSVLVRIFLQDSSSTTGAGLTGLTNASSSLVCYRARDDDGNAGGTAISLASATKGTWTSGGFVEKDATNMPGWYEFGIPNAALASGSRSVSIHFKGATNLAPTPIEIALTNTDNQDGTRGGMTALPNAAAAASGGLPVIGTGSNNFKSDSSANVTAADVLKINNVATTSITTISANLGTTQPVNFTGTGASALAKSDMVDVAGAAVSATTAQLGVNIVNWRGNAVPATNVNGVPLIDLKYILGTAVTEGASGRLAASFTKFNDKASPTGTINSIPDAVAGASGGLLIAGTNTATNIIFDGNFSITGDVTLSGTTTLSTTTISSLALTLLTATNASNQVAGCDIGFLNGSSAAAIRLAYMFAAAEIISVDDATFSPTTTTFETLDVVNDATKYEEQVLYGITGANIGKTVAITGYAYAHSKVKLTVETLSTAPANGDAFIKMGRIEQ